MLKMNSFQTSCSYISEKVSKIRWIPSSSTTGESNFLTGSWGSYYNSLKLWTLIDDQEIDFSPKCSSKLDFFGDISGLEIISPDTLAVSTTEGK